MLIILSDQKICSPKSSEPCFVFACVLFNPIPGRLKKSKNGQGGVNFTPLPHFGRCSQNYISDSHVCFLLESQINSKSDTVDFDARYVLEHLIYIEKLGKKIPKNREKREKNVFQNFPLFSTHDAFKNYQTSEFETLQIFKEYINLLPKKIWCKNIDKQQRY